MDFLYLVIVFDLLVMFLRRESICDNLDCLFGVFVGDMVSEFGGEIGDEVVELLFILIFDFSRVFLVV